MKVVNIEIQSGRLVAYGDNEPGQLTYGSPITLRIPEVPEVTPFAVSPTGPYTSVGDAIEAAELVAGPNSPQLVLVAPGVYIEDQPIPLPENVVVASAAEIVRPETVPYRASRSRADCHASPKRQRTRS